MAVVQTKWCPTCKQDQPFAIEERKGVTRNSQEKALVCTVCHTEVLTDSMMNDAARQDLAALQSPKR